MFSKEEQDEIGRRHCDNYLNGNNKSVPEFVKSWVKHMRLIHSRVSESRPPTVYAEYEGKKVRLTMASRFGDVGIAHDLAQCGGYDKRVYMDQLSNFSEGPSGF